MSDRPRVVIIGGGFAGSEAAKRLKHAPVDVVVIDRTNHFVFQPLLYQVATGGLAPSDISVAIRWSAVEGGSVIAVDLHWREDGGPPVLPTRERGFGSRLLAGSAQQLGAEFEIDYATAGLRCRLRFAVPRPEAQ